MRRPASLLPLLLVLVAACSDADGTARTGAGETGYGRDGSAPEDASASTDTGYVAPSTDGGDGAVASKDGEAEGGPDGGDDAGNGCFLTSDGVYGQCMTTTACTALGNSMSTPGYCPGPADIECCTLVPNVADDPPVPAGWQLMQQSAVTPAMTTWAVAILHDPTTYPMFSTTVQTFGTLMVLARVEWHPPDFQNSAVHRGVTLYQPI